MDQLLCAKCGHVWWPRVPGSKPQICPACKCRKWWEPRGGLRKAGKRPVEVSDAAK